MTGVTLGVTLGVTVVVTVVTGVVGVVVVSGASALSDRCAPAALAPSATAPR
jgi:hypothetical protein